MSDPVERLNTALEGRYAIERELGEGGMATVYLAKDLKHNRNVALKVLKPELAAVVGAERFLAEIETTANLTHPHILPLFDSGEADGFLFYVMPHIEGESLRERIDREKQLGVDEALAITQKVADALDYAHENGVVHRDIKPANILLSERGEPLIADFGIALAVAQAGGGRITETGLSLGTPHYMSPEQATGDRDVDPRSDVYALGCVLFEMLSGQPPFSASTAQAVLIKILTTDAPSITSERRTVPPHVGAALAKALEKLPADRFTSAAEFAAALADESFTYRAHTRTATALPEATAAPTAATARPWHGDRRLVASLTGGLLLALWGGWGWLRTEAAPSELPVPLRMGLSDFQVRAPAVSGERLAISRDGSHIAVASFVDGVSKIFLRPAGQREFEEIPGTDGARGPDFSPDGTWLVFWQDNQINRVEVSGGPILPVTEGDLPHWGLDEMLVFEGLDARIYRVSPFGGDPVFIADGASPSFPHLLPDGQAIVFQGQADGAAGTRIMLAEIESGEVVDLGIRGRNPRYIPTGHLVYGHQDQALMAVSFDLETHRVTGQPSTVLPNVLMYGGGATQFEVSETGTAVYGLSSGGGGGVELVIVDLEGVETSLPLPRGSYAVPRFSPDGRQIAYDNGPSEIGVYNLDTGANPMIASAVQDDPDVPATWSRDGRYVYFEASGPGTLGPDVFRQLADGSADPEHLLRREGTQYPLSTSPDDTQLLVVEQATDRGLDLLIVTEGQDTATPYLVAPWDESMGVISPDGTMVAYVSDESGDPEVYIRSFPDAANQVRVSEAGGTEPMWAKPNGEAVYYRSRNELWRAEIRGDGVGERRMLFEAPYNGPFLYNTNWDVHPDGSSFVFVKGAEGAGDDGGPPVIPIEIVTNWFEELRARTGN